MGYFRRPAPSPPVSISNGPHSPIISAIAFANIRSRAGRREIWTLIARLGHPNTQLACPALSNKCSEPHDRRTNQQEETVTMEDRPGCISIADVQHAVARAFCLNIGEMLSRKRRHRLASARQVAMYLSREMAGGGWMGRRRQAASFPRIGMAFERDHTSVIHACNVVARRRLADADFARTLERIARDLAATARKPVHAA
jgi:hypothetical protein